MWGTGDRPDCAGLCSLHSAAIDIRDVGLHKDLGTERAVRAFISFTSSHSEDSWGESLSPTLWWVRRGGTGQSLASNTDTGLRCSSVAGCLSSVPEALDSIPSTSVNESGKAPGVLAAFNLLLDEETGPD